MKWTIDDFPIIKEFCRKHDIRFTFIVEPDEEPPVVASREFFPPIRVTPISTLKFIFTEKRDDGPDMTFTEVCCELDIENLYKLVDFEKRLVDKIKANFHIYDSAVAERKARRDAELWGVFNKPLDPLIYKPWFQTIDYNKVAIIGKEDDEMKRKESIAVPLGFGKFQMVGIKNVIFNNPATIVIWSDGVKTVVKAENEPYDPEKGMAMAIAKRALGNEGNYYDIFKKWLPKEEKKEPEVIGKIKDMTITDAGVAIKAEVKSNIEKVFGMSEEDMIEHVCKQYD